ncbi:MAG: hypothetical protein KAG20_03850 [Cocleimonas sp.]|nr:hypothetical protein [Cocleimonas sp.]
MTKLIKNNITTSDESSNRPIKVALIGLTMIQQSLMEFYFATNEGSQKYTAVLGKDAEAFITNFDELGSIEAWENLYAEEKKPTIVFSNQRKISDNYFYFPRPITPNLLIEAAASIQLLLQEKRPKQIIDQPAQLKVIKPQKDNLAFVSAESEIEGLAVPDELSFNVIANNDDTFTGDNANTLLSFDALNSTKETSNDETQTALDSLSALTLDKNNPNNELDYLASLEELTLESKANEALSFEALTTKEEDIEVKKAADVLDSLIIEENELALFELVDQNENPIKPTTKTPPNISPLESSSSIPEAPTPSDSHDNFSIENDKLSFDNNIIGQTKKSSDDEITSPDELQLFIDELSDKDSQQDKKQQSTQSSLKKKKERQRWIQLCGRHRNEEYENDGAGNTRFKLEETLLPFLSDTVSFTERANCWMELSYKPLSIIINPKDKLIYSNLSLDNPIFVQICGKKIVEELIEFLEVNEEQVEKINSDQLNNKIYQYDLDYFIWTVSLLVSRGRLPENSNPEMPISIINWLSLNKVEKFPYIMQIAAVFNQHHASLNEVATWMTLPKRYVYSFYNGILALEMIDKSPKTSTKQDLINMGSNKEKHNSMLKNILFKKII